MYFENEIVIPGKPVPLKRTRISGSKCYDSQKKEKLAIWFRVKPQWNTHKLPIYSELLELNVVFVFPISKYYSSVKKYQLLSYPDHIVADLDNLIKMLLDALAGLCFANDRQIVSINAKKVYGNNPGTYFTFTPLAVK